MRVALGARAYDIVIGRGLLASLGRRARGAQARRQGGDRHRRERRAAAARRRRDRRSPPPASAATACQRAAGRELQELRHVRARVRRADRGAKLERGDVVVALGGGVVGDLAGFCAAARAARPRLRAGADHAAGAGRLLGRRQDRDQLAPRQEPDRRLPPADPGGRRHRSCSITLPAREFRAGYAEVAKYGLLGDAGFFAWLEANADDVFAGARRGARARDRHQLPHEGRDRRARRARDRRPRAAQSRPHLRPCLRGGGGVLRPAAARRGGGARHGARLRFLGASSASCRRPTPTASGAILARSACRPTSRDVPGGVPGVDGLMDLMAQDKKVRRGRLTFILARGIGAGLRRARRRGRARCAPSWPTSSPHERRRLGRPHRGRVLPAGVVLLLRQRDGADRLVARHHDAARASDGDPKADHRQPAARGPRAS